MAPRLTTSTGTSAAQHRVAWHDDSRQSTRHMAALLRADAAALAKDILRQVQRESPEVAYSCEADGALMALTGIRRCVEHFADHLDRGNGPIPVPAEVFQAIGRAAARRSRGLEEVQATFRLGARLAWRRIAAIGQQADVPPPTMYELAETIFQYLDQLACELSRGHADAQDNAADERLRLQGRLVRALLAPGRDGTGPRTDLAERLDWPVPRTVAVAVLVRADRDAVPPAVGDGVLLDMDGDLPRMVIPEPDTAARSTLLSRALTGWAGALGPTVPLAEAAKSLRWAQTAVDLMERRVLPNTHVLRCTDHTAALLLVPAAELVDGLGARCLAPLERFGPVHAQHLAETLRAWLETHGSATEVAERLGVHPQTVRYRLRQIRDLWGDTIDDPERRFEIELVLRARKLRGDTPQPHPDSN